MVDEVGADDVADVLITKGNALLEEDEGGIRRIKEGCRLGGL